MIEDVTVAKRHIFQILRSVEMSTLETHSLHYKYLTKRKINQDMAMQALWHTFLNDNSNPFFVREYNIICENMHLSCSMQTERRGICTLRPPVRGNTNYSFRTQKSGRRRAYMVTSLILRSWVCVHCA